MDCGKFRGMGDLRQGADWTGCDKMDTGVRGKIIDIEVIPLPWALPT
jgi:hypothetical protein